jgi:hypothetical protein
MVHEYGEGALLLLKDVLAGGAAAHHLPRPPVLRHGQVGVHQAVVTRLTCKVRNRIVCIFLQTTIQHIMNGKTVYDFYIDYAAL